MAFSAAVDFSVTVKEGYSSGNSQLEFQGVQHHYFHLYDLILCVRLVANVNKVVNLGWVDLLILSSNQSRHNAHKLKLPPGNLLLCQEPVQDTDTQEKRFSFELILHMHLHQPINQNCSHSGIDVCLSLHEVWMRKVDILFLLQNFEDPLDILRH